MVWCDKKSESRWNMCGRLDAGRLLGSWQQEGETAVAGPRSERAGTLSLSLGQPASGASSGDTEGPTHPRRFLAIPD